MNRNLDILFLCDNSLGVVGGGEESLRIIINGVKNEYNVALIEPGIGYHKNPECEIYELSKYKRIKMVARNPILFIKYLHDIKKIINETKPSVIHTQAQVSFFIVGFLKKMKLINPDLILIHTERGLYTKYNKLVKKIFLSCIREMNILVTTTNFNGEHWKRAIKQKYPRANKRYELIENTAGKIFEEIDKSRLNNTNNFLTIGFAGRYCDWKNWPLAEEICVKLSKKIDLHVEMAVGCLDDQSEIETKAMFERLNASLGDKFNGKINVEFADMNQFYYNIDVFILTSNHNTESFGRTLVEAMSRETVVLTTDAGGSVEVVNNIENVCTTADQFVERILDYYYAPDLMRNEKEDNLLRVRKNYSLDNNINKHLKLYNNLINFPIVKGDVFEAGDS
ncbi:glycosyltransferase family 4 protein [Peribacillus butanolivorans]|uniref:Glycosyltransferase n=1 Tax=Peribacillus butanolivorans TaxID=421767 RepID=A0ABN5N0J6_9BACI|nr:glycosyltransferase family 4 protein [Peribacillus butanolivorans]AXN37656.1 glycosyltransferase [Peribacillus butanolivorans]